MTQTVINGGILFSYNQYPTQSGRHCVLDETAFREALDEYAVAEFRFGT